MAVAPAPAAVEHHDPGLTSVDAIRTVIDRLVHERQRLRSGGGVDAAELEANRLAIVYWHRRLGQELAAGARR